MPTASESQYFHFLEKIDEVEGAFLEIIDEVTGITAYTEEERWKDRCLWVIGVLVPMHKWETLKENFHQRPVCPYVVLPLLLFL